MHEQTAGADAPATTGDTVNALFLRLAAGAALAAAAAAPAAAQTADWPARPIRIVVPAPAVVALRVAVSMRAKAAMISAA